MLLTAACGITYDYVTASKSSELVVSDPSTTWQFNKSSTIFEKAYILDIFSKGSFIHNIGFYATFWYNTRRRYNYAKDRRSAI